MIQLQIDFLIPYEQTPTYNEIMWILHNYGELDIPVTITKPKRKRKKIYEIQNAQTCPTLSYERVRAKPNSKS